MTRILIIILSVIFLSESYLLIAKVLKAPVWLSAVLSHSIVISIALLLGKKAKLFSLELIYETTKSKGSMRWFEEVDIYFSKFSSKFIYLGPAMMVGAILISVISSISLVPDFSRLNLSWYLIASLTLIPIVEEVFFRGFCSNVLRNWYGNFWGAYLSAILFSLMHSIPSFDNVVNFQFGIVFGPLVLGILAEYLVYKSGRFREAILFHIGCNATIPIFQMFEPAWLERLGIFYGR